MKYFTSLSELPRAWRTLGVSIIAGLSDGLGITLFIPLLELISTGTLENTPTQFKLLFGAIEQLGLQINTLTLLAIIAALILFSIILSYSQAFMVSQSQHTYTFQARSKLIENLFLADWNYISRQSHGHVINQVITETHRASHALRFELLAISAVIQVLIYMFFSGALSLTLTVIAVSFGALSAVVVYPLHKRAKRFGEQTSAANKSLNFYTLDFLKGIKFIKITKSEAPVVRCIRDQVRDLFIANFRSEINLHRVYYIVQALPVFLLVMIIYVSNEILGLSASAMLVFLLMMARVAPRVAQIQQYLQGRASFLPSYSNYHSMLAKSAVARENERASGQEFSGLHDAIRFRNVSFRYPESQIDTLSNIDFEIRRNHSVAIVGKSGAGKSTVIDLISGLWQPNKGRIEVDGVDLTTLNLASWRRRIGYVTQDITVFNDTILNNLLFVNPDAKKEEIQRSLALSHFAEVVNEMPDGLNTVLGEDANRLSGGQKQRLSLARALVGNPELLLLDEATSALDNESERLIRSAINELSKSMTIIVVAHRLSTIRNVDSILVLEKGRLIEQGRFDELLQAGNVFSSLYEAQET